MTDLYETPLLAFELLASFGVPSLGSREVIDTWSPPQSNHLLAWPLSDLTHRLSHGATFHPLPLSTTTPQGKYRFSSDHRSQVLYGGVSTWLGDHLGIRRVVDFWIHFWTVQEPFP